MLRNDFYRGQKVRQSVNAGYEYKKWHAQKFYMLGPYLATSLADKTTRLYIPMVMYNKQIWRFWAQRKFKWANGIFVMDVHVKNPQPWLDRAVFLFNQMWDNVNEGKEWND